MKIFAVYTNIEFQNKPEWFDEFWQKFENQYPPHITLVQPRYIEEEKIDELKSKIKIFLDKKNISGSISEISFGVPIVSKGDDGLYTLMLPVVNTEKINLLQKDLVDSLVEYGNYVKLEHKKYEENFMPHMTMVVDLSEENLSKTMEYFSDGLEMRAKVTKLILPVVKDTSTEEANDPQNLTTFNL